MRPDADHIPEELRARPQWVGWRMATRDGKPTKVPVNPATGGNADVTDPSTWATFEAALAGADAGRWPGVGFVFTDDDPYTGIDFDKIANPDTGEIDPAAAAEIEAFDSYAEWSPSGTGVHVIVRGTPPGPRRRKGNRECYHTDRFFTVTGRRLTPQGVEERQAALDGWYAATFGRDDARPAAPAPVRPAIGLDDGEVLNRIRRSQQGAKFEALWRGDASGHGGDESAADLALCSILAWWTRGDMAAVDRLFRASGLMRAKWDSPRGESTYGGNTVKKVCESVQGGGYDPDHRSGPTPKPATAPAPLAPVTTPAVAVASPPRTGAEIILAYFREAYHPVFKTGNVIHCEDGSELAQAVACSAAPSRLITLLATATDAPTYRGGGVNTGQLPTFFRKWAGTAWADLRDSLPDEDGAELDTGSAASEAFRQMVREALLTEVTLGDRDEGGRGLPAERLALIEWCRRFATLKAGGGVIALVASAVVRGLAIIVDVIGEAIHALAKLADALPESIRPGWIKDAANAVSGWALDMDKAADDISDWGVKAIDGWGSSIADVDAFFDRTEEKWRNRNKKAKGPVGFVLPNTDPTGAMLKGGTEAHTVVARFQNESMVQQSLTKQQLDQLKGINKGVNDLNKKPGAAPLKPM